MKISSAESLITDPLSQIGVITTVPPGLAPTDLLPVGYYSANLVRCSFCTSRRPHNKGYFAVLPGGQLALCGNCCARKIGGKATVAAIDRKRVEQASSNRRKAAADRLTRGLSDLIELVEPVRAADAKAREELASLEAFVSGFSGYQSGASSSLGLAVGGLRTLIQRANNDTITEKDVPVLAQRRSTAISMIRNSIDDVPAVMRRVTRTGLPEELHRLSSKYDIHLYQDGFCVRLRRDDWMDVEQHQVTPVSLPNLSKLQAKLADL